MINRRLYQQDKTNCVLSLRNTSLNMPEIKIATSYSYSNSIVYFMFHFMLPATLSLLAVYISNFFNNAGTWNLLIFIP